MSYQIYRETPETGRMEWGTRPTKGAAISYAQTMVELYQRGGPLYREFDPVIHVQAVNQTTGERVFDWASPLVR